MITEQCWLVVEGFDGVWRAKLSQVVELVGGSTAWLVELESGLRHHATGEARRSWVLAPKYSEMQLRSLGERATVPVRICSLVPGADPDALVDGDLQIDFEGDIAIRRDDLPQEVDVEELWRDTKRQILRFIEEHGHSAVPGNYHDETGRLDVLVGNIRWFVAGKGGLSLGPFPGIDLVAELDHVEGWSWDAEETAN